MTRDLKLKVVAAALARGDEENESLILREALVNHFKRPEVREQVLEGMKRLVARGDIPEIPPLD